MVDRSDLPWLAGVLSRLGLLRRRGGVQEDIHTGDNMAFRLVRHRDGCYLLEPGNRHLGERYCTCGAVHDPDACRLITAHNLITDEGDIYYAQVSARFANGSAPAPTNGFQNCFTGITGAAPGKTGQTLASLGTLTTSPELAPDTGYPIANDSDTNNPGRGVDVLTWRYSYGTGGSVGTGISEVGISIASAISTSPLLNHADEASFTPSGTFNKTSSDTLTIWVNHTFNGV